MRRIFSIFGKLRNSPNKIGPKMTAQHPLNSLGFAKSPAETRVVVAMSGGVDSSVVAAMLKDEGYDVVGVTLQLYDHGAALAKKGACCAGQDIHDARRVAEAVLQHAAGHAVVLWAPHGGEATL